MPVLEGYWENGFVFVLKKGKPEVSMPVLEGCWENDRGAGRVHHP